MEGQLYFAYGSCMNRADFRRTVPDAVLLGAAKLPDYRLDFTTYSYVRSGGAADVISDVGFSVEGVAWFVPLENMKKLDAREGAPTVYARQDVSIEMYSRPGFTVPALTYSVKRKQEPVRPTDAYLKLMIDGGQEVGLPEEYLCELESRAVALPKKKLTPRSTTTLKGSKSAYVWDTPVRSNRWDEILSEPTETTAFFSREEIIEGSYDPNDILGLSAEEWEYMTDEEIEAELEAYNWWSDADYKLDM